VFIQVEMITFKIGIIQWFSFSISWTVSRPYTTNCDCMSKWWCTCWRCWSRITVSSSVDRCCRTYRRR